MQRPNPPLASDKTRNISQIHDQIAENKFRKDFNTEILKLWRSVCVGLAQVNIPSFPTNSQRKIRDINADLELKKDIRGARICAAKSAVVACLRLGPTLAKKFVTNGERTSKSHRGHGHMPPRPNIRVLRDIKARQGVADNEISRRAYLYVARNQSLPAQVRYQAQLQLNTFGRYTRPTTVKNRCTATGRGRGVIGEFGLCRVRMGTLIFVPLEPEG